MRNLPYLLSVLLATALLAACMPFGSVAVPAHEDSTPGPPPQPKTLEQVTLGLGFIPSVQFAPFYVGLEKGFYADEGIDLTLDYGFENDYLKLVGTGEMRFLIGSSDQVVLGRAQGLPVRYVMNWYTRYPVSIFAKAEEGITSPADLEGKTIGVPGPFGATYIALRALLDEAGLSEDDIQLDSIGFTQASAVSEGLVDAAADYAVNGPVVLALEGIETSELSLDPYLEIPSNGLITNEETLQSNPELVQGMVSATLRSITYTLENPDEAFQIAVERVPEAGGENEAANRAVFDASIPYWTPPAGDLPHGATSEEAWQNVADLMPRIGLIDREVAVDELYTNEFIRGLAADQ